MWDPYASFCTEIMENGLTVHTLQWPYPTDCIYASIVFHTGSRSDPDDKLGLAHLTEHMWNYGLPRPARTFEQAATRMGYTVNLGQTGGDFTRYSFSGPAGDGKYAAQLLTAFGQACVCRSLDHENLSREQAIVIREMHRETAHIAAQQFDEAVERIRHANSPLSRCNDACGTEQGVSTTTSDDVINFMQEHYTGSNCSVVLVSNLPHKKLLAMVRRSPLTTMATGTRNILPTPWAHIPPFTSPETTFRISDHYNHEAPRELCSVYWRYPKHHRASAHVAGEIIYERLFEVMRQKHRLVYSIRVSIQEMQEYDTIDIHCEELPVATSALFRKEVRRALRVSKRDAERHVNQQRRSAVAGRRMWYPNPESIFDSSVENVCTQQRIRTLEEIRREADAVSPESLLSFLSFLRENTPHTRIVCP